jgi:tRNA-specific 2-thiouridylase
VAAKDVARNTVTVVQGEDHPALLKTRLHATQTHWVAEPPNREQPLFLCRAKIRYRQPDQECSVELLEGDRLAVQFERPQRAITEGQSIVFYQDDICLGGAIIESASTDNDFPKPVRSGLSCL